MMAGMSFASRILATLGAVASVASSLVAQCSDPPTPAAGFPLTVVTDQLVTFTDGYLTRTDVRHPAVTAGACGWPLLIAVHGFPGSKAGPIATNSADLARRGYLVVTYDVRGQGSAIGLNPGRGTTLMALHEWIDMFEIIEWVAAAFPGRVDLGRVGVFGISQGGAHSWAAAAWSGRTPPPNARRSRPFPAVHAVAPTVMVPSHTDAATLDGTAFVNAWANLAFVPPNTSAVLDQTLQTTMRTFMLADDPAGMRTWMRNDPGRDFQTLLSTSTTPVFVTMSWLDFTMAANTSLQALAQMPASTPKRAFLTTGMHNTPANAYQSARQEALRLAWFDRFLKGGVEPVELGPPVLSACLPSSRTEYLMPTTLWRHRADAEFTPATTTPTTHYLRQGAALSLAAPTSPETPESVLHNVPPGYDLTSWRADGSGQNVAQALTRMPLSSHSYTTPPFAVDTDVAGIPVLHLEVTPSAARFLLAARLEVVPLTGTPQVIAQGGTGVRQAGGPTPATVTIELSATACVVPAGARLRLSVQNHYLVIPAATEAFRYMPFFTTSRVDLEHKPGATSRLVLPVRAEPRLDVTTDATELSLLAPLPVTLRLRSSAQRAGAVYAILASLSGQGPASAMPGGALLYLQPDALTTALLGVANSALLPGFVGVLDQDGRGSATMNLGPIAPLPAELAAARMHFAPIALQNGVIITGAPHELTLR